MKTLKEAINFIGSGFDIGDETFDYGIYYDYDVNSESYYDRVLDFMAEKIEFVKYQKDWYSTCKITEFMESYQKQFDKFLNEVYCEEYTPQFICNKYKIDKITSDDELFCDVYIELFDNLIKGSFGEKAYKRLFELLKN